MTEEVTCFEVAGGGGPGAASFGAVLVEVWIDERNESVGCVWRAELADAIARSTIALLLVTPPFLASQFIMDTELDALIEQQVRLAPVLVRPCLWRDEPRLEERQFLLDPGRGAIAGTADAEGRIMRACAKLGEYLPPPRVPGPRLRLPVGRLGAMVAPMGAAARAGELHGVPELPAGFVPREQLADLRGLVLGVESGATGIAGEPLGLQGAGGVGKTVLAVAVARDPEVRAHFPDGVFWVTVGEHADLVAGQQSI